MQDPIGSTRLTQANERELDALLSSRESAWWDAFYADRAQPCPFFVDKPDESLLEWREEGLLQGRRALDIGCGHGRNAVYLARQGFAVEAVDYSASALEWARERAARWEVPVSFTRANVFDLELGEAQYDVVYDSGCFHHIAPHRRTGYVDRVVRALRPGGWFGLTCFRPEGGSGYSDAEVYERASLGGGLGYTEERLREIWSPALEIERLRQMRAQGPDSASFGESFLWVMLARKPL